MLEEKGLVLEGGGFRGMYTCGVIDVFKNFGFDWRACDYCGKSIDYDAG